MDSDTIAAAHSAVARTGGSAEKLARADQVVVAFIKEQIDPKDPWDVELVWYKHRYEPTRTLRVKLDPTTMTLIQED